MSAPLKVSFARVGHGWLTVTLTTGEGTFSTAVSDVLYDSLRELAEALHAACANGLAATARLYAEPESYDVELLPSGSGRDATLRLVRYPDVSRTREGGTYVFEAEAPMRELGLTFWRALRRLETEFTQPEDPRWRYPFPSQSLVRLREVLRPARG